MRTIKIPQVWILAIFLLGLLLGVGLGMMLRRETIIVRQGTAETPAALTSVNLMIDYGNGTIKTWNTVSMHEAMSVLNLLETVRAANNITLLTTDVEGKPGVSAIDGIVNDENTGTRWQYWVNNTYEPRTANKYFLKPGDIVLWKYVATQQ